MIRKVMLVLSIIVTSLHISEESVKYNSRRPKLIGLPMSSISPDRKRIQEKIVLYHNYFRARVQPSSANMLKMKWHKGAAKAAHRWAHQCQFLTHDNATGRHIDEYGACGQNIFIATKKVPWLFAIETWWLEKEDFVYGKKKNGTAITGHYTQMVWASSHEIGCGLAKCHHSATVPDKWENGTVSHTKKIDQIYYSYVCNYCPIGNKPGHLSRPYEVGNPCSRCKRQCGRKLCLNPCPVADLWANCRQLHAAHAHWLCNTPTDKGRQRADHCKATCTCKNMIHD